MEPEMHQLAALFPNIATQLRGTLTNLHLAACQLAPAAARERDPALDAKAALLDQSYYQLLRLVNNLSAAALLQDSPAPPVLWDMDLVQLVGDLCRQAEYPAELAGLELRFVCGMDRHICAASQEVLEALLYHLLSNAFKFTPAGGTVTVELRTAGERLLLSVTDTGSGIEESRLPTLFDRYLHKSQQDPRPFGLGLGLPLCRHLAESLGGSIMAESKLGKGSRFTLSFPDRKQGTTDVSDVPLDYTGGFNRTLLALADALPAKAFLLRNQE